MRKQLFLLVILFNMSFIRTAEDNNNHRQRSILVDRGGEEVLIPLSSLVEAVNSLKEDIEHEQKKSNKFLAKLQYLVHPLAPNSLSHALIGICSPLSLMATAYIVYFDRYILEDRTMPHKSGAFSFLFSSLGLGCLYFYLGKNKTEKTIEETG